MGRLDAQIGVYEAHFLVILVATRAIENGCSGGMLVGYARLRCRDHHLSSAASRVHVFKPS